jgi:hypothetical protein
MDACVGRRRRSSRVDQGDVYGHGARPQTGLGRCHSLLVLPFAVLVARRIVLRLRRLSRVGLRLSSRSCHDGFGAPQIPSCRRSFFGNSVPARQSRWRGLGSERINSSSDHGMFWLWCSEGITSVRSLMMTFACHHTPPFSCRDTEARK